MAEAYFYQLNGDTVEAALPRLLDLAVGRGWRVEVRGTERGRMERLDQALWGPGEAFLPHGLSGGPHDALQPVLLTVGEGAGGRDLLVALDGAGVSVDEARALRRVCVMFEATDEGALAAARGQWRALTAAGLPARYHVREGGAWTLKEERGG